ncbi:MAG: S41 family peptidase [Prevotellaceae bacterium]|nr:S41 family peptidase [Prevotellaceae bacterium]
MVNGRPMVVLVDQTTASAAEVLALALQQNGRAVVIGTPTTGKGSVQTASDLPNGAKLIFSWAKVYDKHGNFLERRGVLPVICTSSIKDLQSQFDMFENIRNKKFSSPVLDWQFLPKDKMDEIEKIRQGCKPSDLSEDNTEFTQSLAISILNDKEVYKKLLNIQTKGE